MKDYSIHRQLTINRLQERIKINKITSFRLDSDKRAKSVAAFFMPRHATIPPPKKTNDYSGTPPLLLPLFN